MVNPGFIGGSANGQRSGDPVDATWSEPVPTALQASVMLCCRAADADRGTVRYSAANHLEAALGTNVSAYLVRDTLEDTDEEFLAALGFEHARPVAAWQDAHLGFIRCRGSFILTVYGAFEGQVSRAIEVGDDPLSRVLCRSFEGFDLLAVVLQSATGLAGFSLFVDGLPVRRWCRADGPGTVVDFGTRLPAEVAAAAQGFDAEDTVHQVTEGVLGFDLIDVFGDRDTGIVTERLFRLTP